MTILYRNTSVLLLLILITTNLVAGDKANIIENIDARFQTHQDIAMKIFNYAAAAPTRRLPTLRARPRSGRKTPLRTKGLPLVSGRSPTLRSSTNLR